MEPKSPSPHVCRFKTLLAWDRWTDQGGVRQRAGRKVPTCAECGRERPARRARVPSFVERKVERPGPPPPAGPDEARLVASELCRRAPDGGEPEMQVRGIATRLRARGVPESQMSSWLDVFLRCGWVRLQWRLSGTRETLRAVTVSDASALEEFARPGDRKRRQEALERARGEVAGLTHPVAREIQTLLHGDEATRFQPGFVAALSAVARHVESGDALAERVFAARYLGDSKGLLPIRGRLERRLGALERLGIRKGAVLILVGGAGVIRTPDRVLGLRDFPPFIGLSEETALSVESVDLPSSGLLVVENLTAFEACCRGEVAGSKDCLVVWSSGYPGRGVRRIVERAAAEAGSPIRVWADMDLDGIRIARLVLSWAPGGRPWKMGPEDLAASRAWIRLGRDAQAAVRRDLAERPEGPLADTLRAIVDHGRWVEQESLLGSAGDPASHAGPSAFAKARTSMPSTSRSRT